GVVSVEGDWGYVDRTRTIDGWFYPGGSGQFFSNTPGTSFAVHTQWDAGARARVGVLIMPTVLVYATGGASWLHFQATSSCPATGFGLCDRAGNAFSPAVIAKSATRVGWTAGLGGETMMWGHWLVRAEYRYADYGTWQSATDSRISPFGPTTLTATYAIKLQTHTATFGVAYKFGG